VEPKESNVELRFEPPDVEQLRRTDPQYSDILVSFPLFAGVLENGLLTVKEPAKIKPVACTSGHLQSMTLMVHNGFHDYTVNLQKVIVTANPPSLLANVVSSSPRGKVERDTITFETPVSIQPSQDENVTVDLKMAGMSPGNYLSGFDEDSQFEFRFVYDDGHGRTISNYTYPRSLRVQPSLLVLGVAVFLGIAVGLFLMSVWKILRFEGTGMRKGLAVATTVVIALIVSILALQGELNISFEAFKIRASYDKPLMLFVLSLFATVTGTPLLRKSFGLDKASDNLPSKQVTANSPGN
jgi:hypothetical protein